MNNKKVFIFFLMTFTAAFLYIAYIKILGKESQLFATSNPKSTQQMATKRKTFNKDKNDVLSFLHIQKTGGTTMEKHLVFNIKDSNCQCESTKRPSCMCYRSDMSEIWLMCRFIQPKWPCGLHPDYNTLRKCSPLFMNKEYDERTRRFFYATILRDPVYRFLSEFRHKQRGATWENAASRCRGKLLSDQNPRCFELMDTKAITINDFVNCPYNLAINRQTWMLSNLSKITCDFKTLFSDEEMKKKLLRIAKTNLKKIAYFGLLEYPKESQFVFEKTFDMEFNEPFQKWDTGFAVEYVKNLNINATTMHMINKVNDLDKQLYKFAKELLFKRYNHLVKLYGEPNFGEVKENSRFRLKISKRERLKDNLPKSSKKERLLRMKREKRLEEIKNKKKNLLFDSKNKNIFYV